MRIVAESKLEKFTEQHAELRTTAESWVEKVRHARWENPNDLKLAFPSASLLGRERVVFNLKGNKYRLLARIDYDKQWVRIWKIGTHAEYSKWKL